jgi:hypothetical protein
MNERIEQLGEQAFFETEYDDRENLPETMKRFAELIVRECAELCADVDGGENMFSRAIRKHFGVEE